MFLEEILVTILGRGERMMSRTPGLVLLVVLEHREIDYPQWFPTGLRVTTIVANLAA